MDSQGFGLKQITSIVDHDAVLKRPKDVSPQPTGGFRLETEICASSSETTTTPFIGGFGGVRDVLLVVF